jgi:hypothetical protein
MQFSTATVDFGSGVGWRHMNAAPEIIPLFATPLVTLAVPDAATLNIELRRVIEEREKTHPSTQHSNLGGWQSSWDMDRWGGAPAIRLLAIGRNLANRVTTDRKGNAGSGPHPGYFALTWHGNMWRTSTAPATATNSIPIPAPSGRASTTSTTAASMPIRHWAASSSSWTHAVHCRR